MAAASAMVARLQPKASCQGTMSTPMAPRTPAETSRQVKTVPRATKA